jgi:hypothetical protein
MSIPESGQRHDPLDLFAVLFDQMADVDEPLVAGMGTQPFERSVVRLYGVVIVITIVIVVVVVVTIVVMGVYPICVHS